MHKHTYDKPGASLLYYNGSYTLHLDTGENHSYAVSDPMTGPQATLALRLVRILIENGTDVATIARAVRNS